MKVMNPIVRAAELRAGNFHQSDDFSIPRLGMASVKIDGKSYAAITTWGIHLLDQGELEFIPIRLSEDWMKEFGFTRTNSIEVLYQKSDFPTIICVDEKYYIRGVLKPIEYVHQFQNVYYFLQGEELIIK